MAVDAAGGRGEGERAAAGVGAPSSSGGAGTSSGSGGGASSGGVADGSGGSTTYPNTYSTDLATALGNIDSQYAGQVQQFQQQLGSVQNSLSTITAAGAGVGTGVASTPRYITVQKGETQKDIIQAAGIPYSQLTKLNPSLAAKGSKVKAGQQVRVA